MENKNRPEINKENADKICDRIRSDSEREVLDILDKANLEKKKILDEAAREAGLKKQDMLKALDKDIERLRQKIFSTLNLEKKRLALDEKNRIAEDVFKAAGKLAAEFRDTRGYRDFLEKAILEGMRIVNKDEIDIAYSFMDEKVMKENFENRANDLRRDNSGGGVSIRFQKSDFKDIGVIVRSRDGGLIYDNTFLSRLKRVKEEMYMKLLREMF
ncbi:MAG: V-type ATP synthase subunit E [Candidatus Omnitrophota bacterium]